MRYKILLTLFKDDRISFSPSYEKATQYTEKIFFLTAFHVVQNLILFFTGWVLFHSTPTYKLTRPTPLASI